MQRDVQPIGRLDEDTTGLLLFTDDGALIHKPDLAEVARAEGLSSTAPRRSRRGRSQQLLGGVVLHDDPLPVRAAACEAIGESQLRLTLTEGKYHQVKRMVAAAGNHVVALRRSSFGELQLPADLAPGQWRWVQRESIAPGL